MITTALIFKNIKYAIFVIALLAIVWFYKDYKFQKAENVRQTENNRQTRISDSIKFTSQVLSQREINEYLEYNNKTLSQKLAQDGINKNRIESIISQSLLYRDSEMRSSDVSGIVQDIKNNIPSKTAFIDSTKCLVNKGYILYKGDSLKVVFTSREFKNQSDAVAYWERRQWKFLGIKTRFLGKKQFTAKNYSDCGETKIMKIEKLQKK